MRRKKIYFSAAVGFLEELTAIICGFILPRMILTYFGSVYNGVVASVTQFIGCIALLKSGIGMATKAALYDPLYRNDVEKISGIMSATMRFLRKISGIFLVCILFFAGIYPFCIKENFGWSFTASLVLIISLGTFFQYYFGLGNQLLLVADQRYYVVSLVAIVNTIVCTLVSVFCMKMGMSIHGVKLFGSIIYCSTPIFLNLYVGKKYRIDRGAAPDWESISNRWDAFGMQVAMFVNNNTDIIIASLFLTMKEVSVYTVYYLVFNGIKKIIVRVTTGVEAALGNLKAEKNIDRLKNNFRMFEFVLNFLCAITFSCLTILIIPFVRIYTKGISDANYIRYWFAFVACAAELAYCLRLSYTYMVQVIGAFNETKRFSYIEAAINIISSLFLVNIFGLVGIVLGTLLAMIYRTYVFARFVYCDVLKIRLALFGKRIFITSACILLNSFVGVSIVMRLDVATYLQWLLIAICVAFASLISAIVFHVVGDRKLFIETFKLMIGRRV